MESEELRALEAELADYEECIRECTPDDEGPANEDLAEALLGKAHTLLDLDRVEEASRVYRDLVSLLERADDPELRWYEAAARYGEAFVLESSETCGRRPPRTSSSP